MIRAIELTPEEIAVAAYLAHDDGDPLKHFNWREYGLVGERYQGEDYLEPYDVLDSLKKKLDAAVFKP